MRTLQAQLASIYAAAFQVSFNGACTLAGECTSGFHQGNSHVGNHSNHTKVHWTHKVQQIAV